MGASTAAAWRADDSTVAPARPDEGSFVFFERGAARFCAPVDKVQAIAETGGVHALPFRRKGIAGAFMFRGRMAILCDPGTVLNLVREPESSGPKLAIVVAFPEGVIAFRVDRVSEIVGRDGLQRPAGEQNALTEWMDGYVMQGPDIVFLTTFEKLMRLFFDADVPGGLAAMMGAAEASAKADDPSKTGSSKALPAQAAQKTETAPKVPRAVAPIPSDECVAPSAPALTAMPARAAGAHVPPTRVRAVPGLQVRMPASISRPGLSARFARAEIPAETVQAEAGEAEFEAVPSETESMAELEIVEVDAGFAATKAAGDAEVFSREVRQASRDTGLDASKSGAPPGPVPPSVPPDSVQVWTSAGQDAATKSEPVSATVTPSPAREEWTGAAGTEQPRNARRRTGAMIAASAAIVLALGTFLLWDRTQDPVHNRSRTTADAREKALTPELAVVAQPAPPAAEPEIRILGRDFELRVERGAVKASETAPAGEASSAVMRDTSSHPDATGRVGEFKHVVVRGDTLWAIASKYLGNPWRYPELAQDSRIRNPDLIYPGDVVHILRRR